MRRGEERDIDVSQRNIHQLPPVGALPRDRTHNLVCALTGDRTHDLVHRVKLQPAEPPGQGPLLFQSLGILEKQEQSPCGWLQRELLKLVKKKKKKSVWGDRFQLWAA